MEFDLTSDQIDVFDSDGYLVLRKWIPAEFVSLLRGASSEAINNGLRNFEFCGASRHVATTTIGEKSFVTRVNDLLLDSYPIFMELFACPQIVNVATTLCGDDFISTYESLLVKKEGDGEIVGWHRDMGARSARQSNHPWCISGRSPEVQGCVANHS